jgi:Uma2 family endonuclease
MSAEVTMEAEKESPTRHEYIDGQLYAMAGASAAHNRLARNICFRLDEHLENDETCEPFISDMKVWVSEAVFYYPDVVVACDGPAADPYYRKQPRLIVEVSSPATGRIDRSEKLLAYKQVKSLKEYLIVARDRTHVELFRRLRGDKWQWQVFTELADEVRLASVRLTLSLAQIYRRVRFQPPGRRQ